MKEVALASALVSGVAMAQAKKDRKLSDSHGSPQEVFNEYVLDKCCKGYLDAMMESGWRFRGKD